MNQTCDNCDEEIYNGEVYSCDGYCQQTCAGCWECLCDEEE